MVFFGIPVSRIFSTLLLTAGVPLFAQQSSFQISLLPRAVATAEPSPVDADNSTYLDTVKRRPSPFRPNASDLLIAQAEEKFQSGRRAYQTRDTSEARREFDTAVDLMLEASANPSDRRLYEAKLEEMIDTIHRLDLAGLGAGAPEGEEAQFEQAPLEDILHLTFPIDPKIKGKVLEEVHSTSSQLPLSVNDSVLSYINYFSGRGRRTIVAGLERSGRYRAMISRVLAEEGVPQELIHLAQAESGFLPRAVSRAAAVGMWQFVQFRGHEYGLNQSPWTDDRLDPERATRAAAHHLHDLYNHFGDWYLAIAAYNCGPGTVDKAVERTGYADFWELRARHVLPAETTNYVPIILAMTIMSKNAAAYGLTDLHPEPSLEYETVEVASPTHLALVGDLTDTPVSQLVQMNPALVRNIAPAGYALHIPVGSGDQLRSALELFPEDRRASWRMHRVESGETLAAIAHHYGVSAATIQNANRISGDGPSAGDRLVIPAAYREERANISTARKTAAAKHVSSKHYASASHRTLSHRQVSTRASRSTTHRMQVSHATARTHRPTTHRRA